MAKQRIAILGGGWGAITTALLLTDPDNPRHDHYEITIYQKGWRLGGKGASGRGPHDRVEEHGLHVWMGCYENAFRIMRRVFDEVQPVYRRITDYENNPFKHWRDAFKKHSYIVFGDRYNKRWSTWPTEYPENEDLPGDSENFWLCPWDYVRMMMDWMLDMHAQMIPAGTGTQARGRSGGLRDTLGQLRSRMGEAAGTAAHTLLQRVVAQVHATDPLNESALASIASALDTFLLRLVNETRNRLAANPDLRRSAIQVEIGAVMVKGLIRDGVIASERGLAALDDEEWRAWLARHGASQSLLRSAPVRGMYDLVFAYENGETDRPNLAAGVATRCMMRIMFTYSGAVFWTMQAGMGDTVFAPAYLVLRERGVRFRFFHEVEALRVDEAGTGIAAVDVNVQATVTEGRDAYWPLVNVKDLPCWPAAPLHDQLAEGEELEAGGIDLESFFTSWRPWRASAWNGAATSTPWCSASRWARFPGSPGS